jgi:hypothetical protein
MVASGTVMRSVIRGGLYQRPIMSIGRLGLSETRGEIVESRENSERWGIAFIACGNAK